MKRVLTYGTFDLFHEGHLNIIKRAKALGDYLVVGIVTEQFAASMGKTNVIDSYEIRCQNVLNTGLVDEIIPDISFPQKEFDIKLHNIDIVVMGMDWKDKFDYCKHWGVEVIYLERTPNISTTLLKHTDMKSYIVRDKDGNLRLFKGFKPYKYHGVWTNEQKLDMSIINCGLIYNKPEILDLFKHLTYEDEPVLFNPENDKIDVVIQYVDGSDKEWEEGFIKHSKNYYEKLKNIDIEINASHRKSKLIDYGTIKYLFRSIDTNLAWINNVFLVVQRESQVPKWINRETVKVVLHEEFIPKEFLPTYNSMTLDMFIHKIPGLSERFLLFNDDMIVTNKVDKTKFFDGYKTKETMEDRDLYKLDPTKCMMNYQKMWLQASNLAKREFNEEESENLYWRTNHGISPLIKADIEYFTQKHREAIKNSITQFRHTKNYVHWVFRYFTWKKNGMVQNGPNHEYLTFKDKYKLLNDLNNCKKYDTIVIQEYGFEDGDEKIVEIGLNKHFPNKCKFEI